jgi:hypothetical protein
VRLEAFDTALGDELGVLMGVGDGGGGELRVLTGVGAGDGREPRALRGVLDGAR